MNVSLTPKLEKLIQQKVKQGLYHSASEVIREGLRLLHEQDQLKALRLKELRKQIQAGLDQSKQGQSEAFDVEQLLTKARSRRSKVKK